MKTKALARPVPLEIVKRPALDPRSILQRWIGRLSPNTQRSYRESIDSFARYLGLDGADAAAKEKYRLEAVKHLVSLDKPHATATVYDFMDKERQRGSTGNTINNRLAALKSLIIALEEVGLVSWLLTIKTKKAASRDMSGPGAIGFEKALAAAQNQHPDMAARDTAIISLLYLQTLRRDEVCSLDLEHIDFDNSCLLVKRKGIEHRVKLTMSGAVSDALKAWVKVRGDHPGPLLYSADRSKKCRSKDARLTGNGIYRICQRLGVKAKIVIRPHGFRHAGATTALEVTGGDIRAVQRFTGHKDVRTLMRYDDDRRDLGGEVARKVAEFHRKAQ